MISYGGSIQDYYLDLFRRNQAERKARLAALKTKEDAEKLIAETRRKVRSCFQFPPERRPLNARTTGVLDSPDFIMEKILFQSRENYTVSANYYLPKRQTGKLPTVLFLCGHSPEGKATDFYQKAMRGLALRGFAVLGIDPVGQGERHQFLDIPGFPLENPCKEHNVLGAQMLLNGDWFGSWRTYDAIRGVDYLLTRPEIDPARIGVLGNSGGGTLTTWLAAVDDRIYAAAPGCYVTTWVHDVENELPADIEQRPPNALKYGLEIADFLIAGAPKRYLLLGQANDFFDPRGTEEVRDELKNLYRLLGCEDRIELCIGPTNHGLTVHLREAAYDFFCRQAGIANPSRTEGTILLPETEETFAAPEGRVDGLPGERSLHNLILARTAELKKTRPPLTLPEMRRILMEKSGMDAPFVPHHRVLRGIDIKETGKSYSRFGLETEPGRVMSILFSAVPGRNHIPDTDRILLCIPHQDAVSEIGGCEDRSADLYALDTRGTGSSLPDTTFAVFERSYFRNGLHYASLANMFGKSYLGGKCKDILCAVELLSLHTDDIRLEGHGIGCIPALIAGVLSDKIRKIRLIDGPDSWESMIIPVYPDDDRAPMSCMIQGILEFLDLPDLRNSLAGKIVSDWAE